MCVIKLNVRRISTLHRPENKISLRDYQRRLSIILRTPKNC